MWKRPVPYALKRECLDCPECGGDGWATRKALVVGFRSPFTVNLYCRCSAGQWRQRNPVRDDDFRPNGDRNYESLQALPELWIRGLMHPTWDDRPSRMIVGRLPTVTYLAPDDPRAVATPRESAAGLLRRG